MKAAPCSWLPGYAEQIFDPLLFETADEQIGSFHGFSFSSFFDSIGEYRRGFVIVYQFRLAHPSPLQ
jgi:hypothetical protein